MVTVIAGAADSAGGSVAGSSGRCAGSRSRRTSAAASRFAARGWIVGIARSNDPDTFSTGTGMEDRFG
jgi:hypothetical protein